jgi:preprotein translocase subunit SecD
VIIILKVTPASDPITGKTVEVTGPILDQTAQIIERRLSFADILDCRVSREGPDIAIYGPEDLDVVKVAAVIKKTGRLEFKEKIYDPKLKKLRWRTVMDGRYVKSARAEFNTSGEPVVLFELTEVGTAIFAKVTKRNVGKVIGIFFEGRLLSDPIVREPITGGSVQISGGDLGHDGCREIADYLNAGSLRVTLSVKEVRKIPKKTE